jgi:hypothetical protein
MNDTALRHLRRGLEAFRALGPRPQPVAAPPEPRPPDTVFARFRLVGPPYDVNADTLVTHVGRTVYLAEVSIPNRADAATYITLALLDPRP